MPTAAHTSPLQRPSRAFTGMRPFEAICLAAFFTSLPVWLSVLDLVPRVVGSVEPGTQALPFTEPMALAAMGCALAILFVCLLKTAHAHLSRTLVLVGALAYLAGMLAYGLVPEAMLAQGEATSPLAVALGLPIGAGSVLLCAAWALRLRWSDARRALEGITAVCGVAFAAHLLLAALLPGAAARLALGCLGVAGAAGSAIALTRCEQVTRPAAEGADEANWWDVFGKLDTTAMAGGEEFTAPVARGLFFIVVPLLAGMLWVSDDAVADHTTLDGLSALAGSLVACACTLPLLLTTSDRALINVGFRTLLPFVALATLACGTFAPDDIRMQACHVGIVAFCTLYALLMGALIFSMPGHMRSLALPCAGVVTLVVNLAALLNSYPLEMGRATLAQPVIAAVCMLAATGLLLATPGARMWAHMMDLIPLESAQAKPDAPSLEERARQLAARHGLTEREAQVLPLLTRGHGAAYIASQLGVSESTVRTHRTNIYRKLAVESREELIGLVDAGEDASPELA